MRRVLHITSLNNKHNVSTTVYKLYYDQGINSPMTEFTFFDVFFPKAQMQAHSAGTVKLARDHWLSTY